MRVVIDPSKTNRVACIPRMLTFPETPEERDVAEALLERGARGSASLLPPRARDVPRDDPELKAAREAVYAAAAAANRGTPCVGELQHDATPELLKGFFAPMKKRRREQLLSEAGAAAGGGAEGAAGGGGGVDSESDSGADAPALVADSPGEDVADEALLGESPSDGALDLLAAQVDVAAALTGVGKKGGWRPWMQR